MLHILQDTLTGNEDVGIIFELLLIMFDSDSPLSLTFLPVGTCYAVIELHVPIEVPLPGDVVYVVVDFLPSRIEVAPIWVRIERKCL